MAVSYGSSEGTAELAALSVVDEVPDPVVAQDGRAIGQGIHICFISDVTEGIFVHRHNQRNTRDTRVDDLKIVGCAHKSRTRGTLKKKPPDRGE